MSKQMYAGSLRKRDDVTGYVDGMHDGREDRRGTLIDAVIEVYIVEGGRDTVSKTESPRP
jgi:hypothetical protein